MPLGKTNRVPRSDTHANGVPRVKQKKPKLKRPRIDHLGRFFEIRRGDAIWRFEVSQHAGRRLSERRLTIGGVAAAVQRISHRLDSLIATRAKIIVPDYGIGCAPLIQLEPNRSTVVTVLEYPTMVLPIGVEIIDARK